MVRKVGKLIAVLVIMVAGFAVDSAEATNHYILAGGAGNQGGSDWSNAASKLPASLVRGDTYFIGGSAKSLADPNIGGERTHKFVDADDPSNPTNPITIKKATEVDHGTKVGWQTSYGSASAIWLDPTPMSKTFVAPFWLFCGNYYFVDGITGVGTSDYGFSMQAPGRVFGFISMRTGGGCPTNTPSHNITLAHIEIDGVDPNPHDDTNGGAVALYLSNPTGILRNISVLHCYFHDTAGLNQITGVSTLSYFNDYFARNYANAKQHNNALSVQSSLSNLTVAYTRFEDIQGTGVITCLQGTCSNWNIYGNVFYQTVAFLSCTGGSCGLGGTGVLGDNGSPAPGAPITNLRFYNNTIANLVSPNNVNSGVHSQVAASSGWDVRDNLWVNSVKVSLPQGTVGSHGSNTFIGTAFAFQTNQQANETSLPLSDPFISDSGNDFRIKQATAPGVAFSSPFNTDPSNKIRGLDKTWDQGAYEFDVAPLPPTNLNATAH